MWQILTAGEWRSPAFLDYLDIYRLESDMVVQAHMDESDSDVGKAAAAKTASVGGHWCVVQERKTFAVRPQCW